MTTLGSIFCLLLLLPGGAPPDAPRDAAAVPTAPPAPLVSEPQPQEPQRKAQPRLHDAFDDLLQRRVRDGLVDYDGIRADDRDTLRAYLDRLAQVDVDALGKDQRFAFYVNLYNATMIDAVLDHTAEHPRWTPAADDFAVFKEPRVRLRSGAVTLDHLENGILRPRFADPRVHVALGCGARSCPPLLPRAYRADDLDRVLDANLKAFLHDASRNRIDRDAETVHLSKIFEWFAGDFGDEAGVRELLSKHFGEEVGGYRIRYLDYSWQRNEQPAKPK